MGTRPSMGRKSARSVKTVFTHRPCKADLSEPDTGAIAKLGRLNSHLMGASAARQRAICAPVALDAPDAPVAPVTPVAPVAAIAAIAATAGAAMAAPSSGTATSSAKPGRPPSGAKGISITRWPSMRACITERSSTMVGTGLDSPAAVLKARGAVLAASKGFSQGLRKCTAEVSAILVADVMLPGGSKSLMRPAVRSAVQWLICARAASLCEKGKRSASACQRLASRWA